MARPRGGSPARQRTPGQVIYSDHHSTPASRAAERVCIQLERGAIELAHAVIDDFAREWSASQAAQTKSGVPRPIGDLLQTPIAQLALNLRTVNTLDQYGVLVVDDLAKGRWSQERLMQIPNFGPASLAELDAALSKLGLPGFFRPNEPATSEPASAETDDEQRP